MRLATVSTDRGPTAAVLRDDLLIDARAAAAAAGLGQADAGSVRALLSTMDSDSLARLGEAATTIDDGTPLAEAALLAPVTDPEKIICLGLNYHDHAKETGQDLPERPMWFPKFANSLIGTGAPIELVPTAPDRTDYEAELAVVIGRTAKGVSETEALGHVAGAMPFNDVSARDLQMLNPLWTTGKAVDTFAPCGPALVLMDEIDDLQAITLRTRIDGEVVQEGTTADQIFGVAEVVSWLSRTMTLRPGDIIATGTPAGVGAARRSYLKPGQLLEVEAEGLGTVSNPVVLGN
jgi:acylpyruvate hydrolase